MIDINILPEKPGIYFFKHGDKILYIGKAKNLKKRVKSYFQKNIKDLKTAFLIKKIKHIEWIVTNNEIEALILENNLIKKHKPPYNIKLIDDKTYPYIEVDILSKFPSIKITRQKRNKNAVYFGPYTSALKLKYVLNFIQKNFHIRRCSDKKFKNRNRPCLNYQLNICPAPCCNKISAEDYRKNIKKVILFLKGKNNKLILLLKKEMNQLSNDLEFEKAAKIRDLINSLENINESQLMEFSNLFDKDIFYFKLCEENIFFQVLRSRNGKMLESNFFSFNNKTTFSNNIFEDFLTQYYSINKNVPDKIVINKKIDTTLLKEYFIKKFKKKVNIIFPSQNSEDFKLLALSKENIEESIKRKLIKEGIFVRMKQKMHLKNIPLRIDAFDIATFQGKSSVGTRVVFINGVPEKKLYRKYVIQTVEENQLDDFKMTYEIIKRSINECLDTDNFPDLILVDGGKGQLNIAKKVLHENNLAGKIDIISIAKDKEYKIDKIYIPNRKNCLNLNRSTDIINLLMQVRDEVHRFSITFHKKREENKIFTSILLKVKGIGEKRAKELLKHYKTLDEIKKANFNELKNLPFLNDKIAKNLTEFFKHQ
jgi:excinuclease ABC subunit C